MSNGANGWTKVANLVGDRGRQGVTGPQGVTGIGTPRAVFLTTPGQGLYVVPSDVRAIFVEIVGGGGAGGWSPRTFAGESSAGGGGGAGGYCAAMFPFINVGSDGTGYWDYPELEIQYPYYIGRGGVSGYIGTGDGEDSWFGELDPRLTPTPEIPTPHTLNARGGESFSDIMWNGTSTDALATGGLGGGSLAPDHGFFEKGGYGSTGIRLGGEVSIGGKGASSSLSHGGGKERTRTSSSPGGTGYNATGYGCGGSGAITFGNMSAIEGNAGAFGGNGFQGVIKISEYF